MMETNEFEKFLTDNYNSEVVEESPKRKYYKSLID